MGYGMAALASPMSQTGLSAGAGDRADPREWSKRAAPLKPMFLKAPETSASALLDHLQLPYACQDGDLIFLADYAGIFGQDRKIRRHLRPPSSLPGFALFRRVDVAAFSCPPTTRAAPAILRQSRSRDSQTYWSFEMFRQMNKSPQSGDGSGRGTNAGVTANVTQRRVAGKETTNVAQAYTMELLATEVDWSHIMIKANDTKIWFINGGEDPLSTRPPSPNNREVYRIDIEVIPNAGQMMIYQGTETIIPRLAAAAKAAQTIQT
jgi:hypothetical protein